MTGQHHIKDPNAVLDYAVDWSAWLEDGDSITASEWEVEDGITKDSDSSDDTVATVWLSGGTVNETYRVTNRITTSAGRIDDRSLWIRVLER